MKKYNCIVVLGPTASGKTRLACQLAYELQGEIISADSRQVYKGLDIGTGKDLSEYMLNGVKIPYHVIDCVEPTSQFYLHDFVAHLKNAFDHIQSLQKLPVICGGTGLYLDALRKDFSYTQIKENNDLRAQLEHLPKEDLIKLLQTYSQDLTKHVDLDSKKRIIRGIEIADFLRTHKLQVAPLSLPYNPYYIGVSSDIALRKTNISERLTRRLNNGMIEEVEGLLQRGISHERLQFFGLEYKFVSKYLLGEIDRNELNNVLRTAIFQFAKRQMTWFRKMEKEGVEIHWLDAMPNMKELVRQLKSIM